MPQRNPPHVEAARDVSVRPNFPLDTRGSAAHRKFWEEDYTEQDAEAERPAEVEAGVSRDVGGVSEEGGRGRPAGDEVGAAEGPRDAEAEDSGDYVAEGRRDALMGDGADNGSDGGGDGGDAAQVAGDSKQLPSAAERQGEPSVIESFSPLVRNAVEVQSPGGVTPGPLGDAAAAEQAVADVVNDVVAAEEGAEAGFGAEEAGASTVLESSTEGAERVADHGEASLADTGFLRPGELAGTNMPALGAEEGNGDGGAGKPVEVQPVQALQDGMRRSDEGVTLSPPAWEGTASPPTTLSRTRRPASASPGASFRPASASPARLAAGSGAMAVRGRLAASTSREAVLRQEAEMAAADLEIMTAEKAALEADLAQEAAMRAELESELAQVLDELQVERAEPYKQRCLETEAQLKVALARVGALEEELRGLQVDAARDRAVAEVAERKREDADRRRNVAEQKVADGARLSAMAAPARQGGCPTCAMGGLPQLGYQPAARMAPPSMQSYALPPPPQPPHLAEEVATLKGRLSQAEATNAALMKAEMVRSGLMDDPQEATERRLRMLEAAMGSPMGSPTRRRQYGGMLEGALGMNGGGGGGLMMGAQPGMGMNGMTGGMMGGMNGMMGGMNGMMGGGHMMMAPQPGMMMAPQQGMMGAPSQRMHSALQQLDWQMGGGGGGVGPQGYQQMGGYGMGYGATPRAYADTGRDFHNEAPPAHNGSARFERSLRESIGGGGGGGGPPTYQFSGPAVARNTDPNRMDEEALRQARMQYHNEKMQIMNMQLARQQAGDM
eukprot:jgi/Tetstr1/424868/TSEL_015363.t1